jgi:hypothetical protein
MQAMYNKTNIFEFPMLSSKGQSEIIKKQYFSYLSMIVLNIISI